MSGLMRCRPAATSTVIAGPAAGVASTGAASTDAASVTAIASISFLLSKRLTPDFLGSQSLTLESMGVKINDLTTPCLLVDVEAFEHNIAVMTDAWPGLSLRPHVKAWKCTAIAQRLADAGHPAFCCATVHEMEGMVA